MPLRLVIFFLLVIGLHGYLPAASACSCEDYDYSGFLTTDGYIPKNSAGVLWIDSRWGSQLATDSKPNRIIKIATSTDPDIPIEFKYWHLRLHYPERGSADWISKDHESKWYTMDEARLALNSAAYKNREERSTFKNLYRGFSRAIFWIIRPQGGLRPGETYTFTAIDNRPERRARAKTTEPQTVTITVSNKRLDRLKYKVPIDSRLHAGFVSVPAAISCSRIRFTEKHSVDMLLPQDYAEFKNALFFETVVNRGVFSNGSLWHPRESLCDVSTPGSSKLGKGKDRVYGVESVQMRAILPGTKIMAETPREELPGFKGLLGLDLILVIFVIAVILNIRSMWKILGQSRLH